MPMTLSQALAEWRKKAEAATPRTPEMPASCLWLACENGKSVPTYYKADSPDVMHYVSCSPARVLALLAVVEAAVESREKYGIVGVSSQVDYALSALATSLGAEDHE